MSDYANTDPTEAAVVADLAARAVGWEALDRGALILHGGDVVDLEVYGDAPRRASGTVALESVASLGQYISDHATGKPDVYVSTADATIVAILDPHRPDSPSWQDRRAVVTLKPSPEWAHWLARDGSLLPQLEFAHHVEQHLADVRVPSGAELLEVAQSIEGTTAVEFLRSERLADGQRRFTYRETTEGKAGQSGELTIPQTFELGIPVFEFAAEGYPLTARLRWRISADGLRLGYELDRPDVVWKTAVDHVVDELADALSVDVYRGRPKA